MSNQGAMKHRLRGLAREREGDSNDTFLAKERDSINNVSIIEQRDTNLVFNQVKATAPKMWPN